MRRVFEGYDCAVWREFRRGDVGESERMVARGEDERCRGVVVTRATGEYAAKNGQKTLRCCEFAVDVARCQGDAEIARESGRQFSQNVQTFRIEDTGIRSVDRERG